MAIRRIYRKHVCFRWKRYKIRNSTIILLFTMMCFLFIVTFSPRKMKNFSNLYEKGMGAYKMCHLIAPSLSDIQSYVFQHVEYSDTYVYSAFLDRRIQGEDKIRIIGISSDDSDILYCNIHYMNGSVFYTRAEKVRTVLDPELHKDFKYRPYLFYCNESQGNAVKAVSLTVKPCDSVSNILTVLSIHVNQTSQVPDSMAVCLRTIHHVNSPYYIVEFVEMQRILGVQHIYIYGLEHISNSVRHMLDYYSSIGVVTIYPWKLPVKNSPVFEEPGEIAIHGQYAINNDCLYRTMNIHRQVFMHDLDEYVIARNSDIRNAKQLLEKIEKLKTEISGDKSLHEYASYGFLNCYFCLTDQDYSTVSPNLVSLKRYKRHICLNEELEEAWWKDNEQTHTEGGRGATMKVVVYPTRVILMGVHGVTHPIKGFKRELVIPTNIATMHHYKKPKDLGCDHNDTTLIDKYSNLLKKNVNTVCEVTGILLIL